MAIPQAIVQDLEGEVSVTRNGEVVNIKAGDALLPGDVVETGNTGRLTLSFPGDGTQTPAEGVMTSGGRITLGEQATPNGQQIVVLEDTECFEFTTEVDENSAAAEGTASGLFGAELGGMGALTAAGGAVAAGVLAGVGGGGGGGDSTDTGATTASPSMFTNTPLGNVDTSEKGEPETPEEMADQNLNEATFQTRIIEPIQQAAEKSQADPASTPDNFAEAGSTVATNLADIANDGLSATTGTGSPGGDIGEQLVDGINQTPLGEPLSPVTQQVAQTTSQELGLEQIDSLADAGLVTQLVQTVDSAIDTTPLGEPLTPVTDGLTTIAQQVDTGIADGLTAIQDALAGGAEAGGGNPVTDLAASLQNGDNPLAGAVESLQSGDAPDPGGLLGDASSLSSQMPSGGEGGGDLLGSVTTGIQSTAAEVQNSLPDGLDTGGLV